MSATTTDPRLTSSRAIFNTAKMIKILSMLQHGLIHNAVISEYYHGFMRADYRRRPIDTLAGFLAAGITLYLAISAGPAAALACTCLFIIRRQFLEAFKKHILTKIEQPALRAITLGFVEAVTMPLGLIALPRLLAAAGLAIPALTAPSIVSYASSPLNLSAIFVSEVAETVSNHLEEQQVAANTRKHRI